MFGLFRKKQKKKLGQLVTNIATMIDMHFLKIRAENHGDLLEAFEQDKFIVGYIGGVCGVGAHVAGTKSSEDIGYVVGEVLERLFPSKRQALMNTIIDWKDSGDQVFQDAAKLGMNEFVNAHKIMVTGIANGR